MNRMSARPPRLFIVAGEDSGDALGGRLMEALSTMCDRAPAFSGVGGEHMQEQGLKSLFSLGEIAVMGPVAILTRLPALVRRVYQTVDAAIAADPDVLIIIDSPEFTHPIAKRIRRRRPDIPILDYVSPSVWAWRPGRARKMRPYIDHVLALLPFEPEVHARLGGPPCTYVGHPLIEQLPWLENLDPAPLAARLGLDPARPTLVVLPGSRRSEVTRLMPVFGEAIGRIATSCGPLEVILPVAASAKNVVEANLAGWSVTPHLIEGRNDRFRAFKLARAAFAASGTVTLELALAGTPMVVAYKVEPLSAPFLRRLITAESIVLPNLILGDNLIPELIQEDCTAEALAARLIPLLSDTPQRRGQEAALAAVPSRMAFAEETPSRAAARVVIDHLVRATGVPP
jgi:lipid-A-disaccharide synthase